MLQVVKVIDEEAVPLLKRCSLAGHAQFKTSNPIFAEDDRAADMLIDILTDRGFSVAHTMDERVIPVRAMQKECAPARASMRPLVRNMTLWQSVQPAA